MEQPEHHQPPKLALSLFRLFCHPGFIEEIEGDLTEKYQLEVAKRGLKAARWQFYSEVLKLFKPNIVFNLNQSNMNGKSWLYLFLISCLVVLASVAPFLPGSNNNFSHSISTFIQTMGSLGLVFMPLGLVWLVVEFRNKKDQKLNLWTNGFYLSLLALFPLFAVLILQLAMAIDDKNILIIAFIIAMSGFCIYHIRKLKQKTAYQFNLTPLYLVLIPFIALLSTRFAIGKAAAISRDKAILKTEPLITAIEKYKTDTGVYPENLEDLERKYISSIPKLETMGIRAYQYKKRNETYELSFEQLWHWNATEVVMYNKSWYGGIKGNFESFETSHANWRYFMAD